MDSKKKYLYLSCFSLTLSIFSIVVTLFYPWFLMKYIIEKVNEQLVMQESNYQEWGQIPGSTGAVALRQYTFYNYTNYMDVIFRKQKPKLVEVGPFILQEMHNFTNVKFNQDGNIVNFDFQCWFKRLENDNTDFNQQVQIVDFISLGAWRLMNTIEKPLIALKTISAFIYLLQERFMATSYSLALSPLMYNDYNTVRISVLSSLTNEKAKVVWNDFYYGLKNQSSLQFWVEAALDEDIYNSTNFLRDYFDISFTDMNSIIQTIKSQISGITSVLDQWFCNEAPQQKCTNEYMTAYQWGQLGVSMNTPADIREPQPTITWGNNTAFGYAELGYYFKEYFLKNINGSQEYQEVFFPSEWTMSFLNHTKYDPNNPKWLIDSYVLLNKANMEYLFENGQYYDQTKNVQYLENIKIRFKLNTTAQAHVIWSFIFYQVNDFIVQSELGGETGTASFGGEFSLTIAANFSYFSDHLRDTILIEMLSQDFKSCQEIINYLDIDPVQSFQICSISLFSPWTQESISNFIILCENPYGTIWDQVINVSQISNMDLIQLCDPQEIGFGSQLQASHNQLKQLYDCHSWSKKCSRYELALKQWTNSTVTLNLPQKLKKQPSLTASSIWPQKFKKPFEFNWFVEEFNDIFPNKQTLTYEQAQYLLSYDCLMAPFLTVRGLLFIKNQMYDEFKAWFLFDDPLPLQGYMRYIFLEFFLQGQIIETSVAELIFGYEHSFLKTFKNEDPSTGLGDPSVASVFGFSPNVSLEESKNSPQSMFTGKLDQSMRRKFNSIYDRKNFVVQKPYFNGIEVYNIYENPWNIDEPVTATDGQGFGTNLNFNNELQLSVPMLFRQVPLRGTERINELGLDVYRYKISEKFWSINPAYYNEKWYGTVNLTQVQIAPIFITQRNFYMSDEKLASSVEIYKYSNLTSRQLGSKYDETYFDIEPITGIPVSGTLCFQINVEYEGDERLYPKNYAMIPIVSMYGGVNLTQQISDQYFGQLKLGLKSKIIVFYCSLIIGIMFSLCSFGCFVLHKKQEKRRLIETLYGESLQPLQN